MKKHRTKIIAGVIILAVLAVSLLWGGLGGGNGGTDEPDAAVTGVNTPGTGMEPADTPAASETTPPPADTPETAAVAVTDDPESTVPETDAAQNAPPPESTPPESTPATPDDSEPADSAPPETKTPADVGGTSDGELSCTLIISCATVLDNMDKLREGKETLIPEGGIIFSGTVVFYEGESVFNVLLREVKSNKIHMEYVNAPLYNSAYIEGIGNLYEFDCGDRSGWMYSVNGSFPNYGSSRYELSDGDTIEWLYTCDRGADIGGAEAADSYVKE